MALRVAVLHVEHAGQGDAVGAPAAAVGDEVLGLGSTSGDGRAGEVVGTADEAGVCGAVVIGRELGVLVGGSFGGLRRGWISGVRLSSQDGCLL